MFRNRFIPRMESLEPRRVPTGGPPPLAFLETPTSMATSLAMHIHPHLTIMIDGVPRTIPADIGFTQAGWLPLHTHDASGIVHVESPVVYDFRLGDFFTIWTMPFNAQNFMGYPVDAGHTLTMTVNGVAYTSFTDYVLRDHDQIVLNYTTTPTLSNLQFVDQIFHDLLHRPVDPSSLYALSYNLTLGRMSRGQVVQALETSAEYQTNEVQSVFLKYLRRAADVGTTSAFVNYLRAGGTWEQEASILIGSDEYWKAHGGTVDGFLAALYVDTLGRTVDAAGRSYFTHTLQSGVTRTQVAAVLLAGDEYGQRMIQGLYQQYVHHNADPGSLAVWLQARHYGLRQEQIIALLVASAEYAANAV